MLPPERRRRGAPLLAVLALAAQGRAQEKPHRLPGIETSRVVLEARVADPRGQPLLGLGPADFRLEVDGRVVPVESVVWVHEGGGPSSRGPSVAVDSSSRGPAVGSGPEGSAGAETADPSAHGAAAAPRDDGAVPGRLLVLLFQKDFEGTRLRGLLRAVGQAKELLSPLTPRDRVAVLTYDSHLRLHLDLTADRAAVSRTLDESVLLRWPDRVEAGPPPSLAAHLDRTEARDAASPEQALLALGRALAALPGSKTVLLFGYGLGELRGGTVVLDHDYDAARRALEEARTAVFCLDVTQADWHSLEVGLREVALDTGGQYFKVHENAGFALRRVAAALSGHYVLAFERPEGRRGEHRVRLALDGRRGTVLTRSRYVD